MRCGAGRWRMPPISRLTGSCRSTSVSTRTSCVTDLVRLVRAHNLLLAAAGVLAGGWIALGTVALPKLLACAALSGVGLGAAGNAANDVQDVAADRINAPGRHPLASGRLRGETAHLVIWLGIAL